MVRNLVYGLVVVLCIPVMSAQGISGKVVDAKTGESIPYANIIINSENLITNSEGDFSLPARITDDNESITVSFLGYVSRQLTVRQLKNNSTVALAPGFIDLDIVDVSNVRPDPYQIMQQVKKNLPNHYKANGSTVHDKLFYRESGLFKPSKFEIEIDKSSGFSKTALKSTNSKIEEFTGQLIAHPPKNFTDMLCDYYISDKPKTDSSAPNAKLDVVKATKLRDEDRSASLEDMEKGFTNLLLQHLDTAKYYRIKSGLLGSHDTVSLRKDFNKKKLKKKKIDNLSMAKGKLSKFMVKSNFLSNDEMDFVNKPELYEYFYEGATLSANNELVYVLAFKPKKSKANYTGKLYVSETDYAVVRTDFNLAKGKTMGGVNVKWLFGVKYSENVNNGTLIFKKNRSGEGYYLQYGAMETGQYFYVNRPLKFIELTDEERDVVAFDFKVEGNSRMKSEVLNISRSEIAETTFSKVDEKDFSYINLKRYDPKMWKDYTSIEPLEEMKQFSIMD